MSESADNSRGKIKLCGTSIGMCTDLLNSYMKEYPGSSFDYFVCTEDVIKTRLQNGEVDFAVCSNPLDGAGIVWEQLFDERLVLIVHQEHPFASRAWVDISELENETFIIQQPDFNQQGEYAQVFLDAGFSPKMVISTNELEIAYNMADLKAGIMVSSFFSAQRLMSNPRHLTTAVPLRTSRIARHVGLARANGHYFSCAVRQLYDYMRHYYSQLSETQQEIFGSIGL